MADPHPRPDVYDPLDVEGNLVREVLRAPVRRLPPHVSGSGVYLLYYGGSLDMYREIRSPDSQIPIYVGLSTDLADRLRIHAKSLDEAQNLERVDFTCRVLRLSPGWEERAEKILVARFNPWWNQDKFKGFGNNGSRRHHGEASAWDVIHPGRKAAMKMKQPRSTLAALRAELAVHHAKNQDGDVLELAMEMMN